MSLPYAWSATGTVLGGVPKVGDVFPYEHAVYRVTSVDSTVSLPDGRNAYRATFAPLDSTDPDDVRPVHLGPAWLKYPDRHYPVCATCREPMPCRERTVDRLAATAAATADRFATEGVCPACMNVVTSTELSIHYPDNVVVPFGPPLTFHWRAQCRNALLEYDTAWARVLGCRPLLSCPGVVMWHATTYECTRGEECAGSHAIHQLHTVCSCREASINRWGPLPMWQEVPSPDGFPVRIRHARPTVAPSDAAMATGEAS